MRRGLTGFILIGSLVSPVFALPFDCTLPKTTTEQKICKMPFDEFRQPLYEAYLTAYLVTDAPNRLIQDTHNAWLNQLNQCKNTKCLKQQLGIRIEDLNFYTSMNQSLTQHFLKYENGEIAKNPIHLQIHQLTKDRLKIEAIAYHPPNTPHKSQNIALLAYATPETKHEIFDNEHQCKYQLKFQKAILTVTTQQKKCHSISGTYRLYD